MGCFLKCQFKFDIKHLKCKENQVDNTLSRRLNYIYEISYTQVKFDFTGQIKEASQRDPKYQFLW